MSVALLGTEVSKAEVRRGSLRVQVIAAESLGARSMATKVTTPDVRITIDPGVALGSRFGMLPHPLEYKVLSESRAMIRDACRESEVLVITHYHYDHYSPPFNNDYVWTWSDRKMAEELYRDRVLLMKDPRENINFSQRIRAYHLSRFLGSVSREVRVGDGSAFEFGDTRIVFSRAVPHGEEGSPLGYVVMVKILWNDQSFLFASDVQGPMSDFTREAIIGWGASTLYVGGPPAYLVPHQIEDEIVRRGIRNLAAVAESTPVTIVDHHLMRAANWRELVGDAETRARDSGKLLMSAAAYSNRGEQLLEATRDRLYRDSPPGSEFLAWTRKSYEKRRSTPPPI